MDPYEIASTTINCVRVASDLCRTACQIYESMKSNKLKDRLSPLHKYCLSVQQTLAGLENCELAPSGIAALGEEQRCVLAPCADSPSARSPSRLVYDLDVQRK